ncbi:MAG TPA: chemotaxis protein CheW [Mycobacteriales bacterium]|nr:chemotaxis protein CheW [Mycobacteriales bacterium]
MGARQLCTFMLGDLYLGVDVCDVQEVLREQPMTGVPSAPDIVSGLINLRGEIVTAIDLRRRLGMGPRSQEEPAMNVVVHGEEGPVSLLVDEIGDVVDVEDTDYQPAPETVQGPAREVLAGTYPLPDRLLLLLDTAAACTPGRSL